MAPILSAPALFQGHDPRTHWERPMSSEGGTHHISGFCLFCPFPPAAHPLITSSLGRQCNNRTKEPGLFPFVSLSFEALQLSHHAHGPAIAASRGSPAPEHHTSAPGDRGPVLWHVGKASNVPHTPRGCPLLPSPGPHRAPWLSALVLFHLQTSHHLKRDQSPPQRQRQPPSSLQHMAWRLLGWFSLSSHKSRLPLSQPPLPRATELSH